jgi:hypothetical protein
MAGIHQICVVPAQVRCDALGDLVVEFKVVQLETPLLALQTINATEGELVPKPWAEGLII